MKLRTKQLVVSSFAAVTLALSAGAALPAGAMPNNSARPKFARQCDNPGFRHFGFASKQDCLKFVSGTGHEQGHGYGYNGNGHDQDGNHTSVQNTIGDVFSHIGNVTNSVINVTINFVTNIFH